MKKVFFFFAILMLSAAFAHAQAQVQVQLPRISADVIIGNRPPNPAELRAMRSEEALHPNITRAMNNIQAALDALSQAPDEFGGHKGQAQADLKKAWVSLRKALYYRLYQDR
jgi:hypothetical protein